MFGFPLFTLLALAFVAWRVYTYFKKKSTSELELEKSLEDETIYVEGVGDVRVEELGEEVSGINSDSVVPRENKDSIKHDSGDDSKKKRS